MIHKDRDQFIDVLNMTVQRTGFRAPLLEKDYYLTLILSRVNELSENLIFKGGTCLNKIYYSYYRLSDDLRGGGQVYFIDIRYSNRHCLNTARLSRIVLSYITNRGNA